MQVCDTSALYIVHYSQKTYVLLKSLDFFIPAKVVVQTLLPQNVIFCIWGCHFIFLVFPMLSLHLFSRSNCQSWIPSADSSLIKQQKCNLLIFVNINILYITYDCVLMFATSMLHVGFFSVTSGELEDHFSKVADLISKLKYVKMFLRIDQHCLLLNDDRCENETFCVLKYWSTLFATWWWHFFSFFQYSLFGFLKYWA